MAGERTDLAWSRSGLAVLACLAAIVKKLLPEASRVSATTIIWFGLAVAAGAWIAAMVWARNVAESTLAGRLVIDARTLRFVAYGTTALAVVSVVVAFAPD